MFGKARLLLSILALMLTAGCSNPCGELAERTCQEQGETTEACTQARERADYAGGQAREQCKTALDLVEAMKKSR